MVGTSRKEYQRYPSGVGRRTWAQGHLTALDAMRIAAWKQAQIPAAMSVNPPQHIEAVTAHVISALRASGCQQWLPLGNDTNAFWQKYEDLIRDAVGAKADGTGLYGMKGVEYPTASAILCILDPLLFPVIDQHAVRAIYGTTPNGKDFTTSKWYCATVYTHYTRHLANVIYQRSPASTIHQLDLKAMRAGQQIRIEAIQGIDTTRRKWPIAGLPSCHGSNHGS